MSHVLDNRTKHTQLMQQEIVKLDLEKAHQQHRQCSIKIGQHCLGQAVSFPQQRSLTNLSDRDQQKPARKDRMGLGGGLKPPQAPAVHAAGEAQLLLVSQGGSAAKRNGQTYKILLHTQNFFMITPPSNKKLTMQICYEIHLWSFLALKGLLQTSAFLNLENVLSLWNF